MEGTILIDQETGKKYKLMEIKNNKIAFVIGHTPGADKGAYSETLQKTEFELFKSFADGFLQELGDVFTHDASISSYTQRQSETAQRTKEYDYAFELHFNAAGINAVGCEGLYYHSNSKGKKIAERFCELVRAKMNIKSRGAKPLKDGDRGFGFVQKQKGTALVLEPFFGSSPEDCQKFDAMKYKAVISDLCEYIKTL